MRFSAVLPGAAGAALVALAVALVAAAPKQERPAVVVTVSARYEGASAEILAETVAAPIEQRVNGVEELVRIESESHADGRYLARIRFKPRADAARAVELVRNRVALALPLLPEAVRGAKDGVKVELAAPAKPGAVAPAKDAAAGKGEERPKPGADAPAQEEKAADKAEPAAAPPVPEGAAVLVLVDQADRGRRTLRQWAAEVEKRLAGKEGAVKVELFPPPDVDRIRVQVDRERLVALGLDAAAVDKAISAAVGKAPAAREASDPADGDAPLAALRKTVVKNAQGVDVPLADVATIERISAASAVYRLDLYPAVRIVAFPPVGETAAAAAARWKKLVAVDSPAGFVAVDLTGK